MAITSTASVVQPVDQVTVNLFSEFVEEWGLTEEQIERANALAATDGLDASQMPSKALLFLYAKRFLSHKKSLFRKSEFDDLLDETDDSHCKHALKRLNTIIGSTEASIARSNVKPGFLYDSFVVAHPVWEEGPEVFVCHRNHRNLEGKEHALVERFQENGLCYMHAPVVLQHYLVAMNNNWHTPMLDVSKFVKQKMDASQLYSQIWNNQGGDSLNFFKAILATPPGPSEIIHESNFIGIDITELLKEYGPGLVSGFHVTQDFQNTSNWQHHSD
ncbi:hypothetical protein HDU79_008374 [Rhizoclosmatium sp. JEL0117]|nr:hypothetical protein HDU79_008374 [Rhizoclosmatium sp. JEL0117]